MTVTVKSDVSGNYGILQVNGADSVLLTQAGASTPIYPISASVAANALTISLASTALQFRSSTLTSGTPVNGVSGNLSITVPSGATLGTVNNVQSRVIVLVAYNGGNEVLCVTNLAGGLQLDETNLISPTTISAGATSANVIYSSTAVSANSPYRVVGFVDSTQTTAGTWASSPTLVQGSGGQALTGLSSLGYGQTWQTVTGSRVSGTTYYNTTGKPISVIVTKSTSVNAIAVAGGITVVNDTSSNNITFIVPAQMSYSVTCTGIASWVELR